VRLVTTLLVLVLLVVGAARLILIDPQTWMLAQAVSALGPFSGWRCARSATYVYDPARELPDATLVTDRPEDTVLGKYPTFEVDNVEVNLRGGDTLVSVHAEGTEADDRRVYVLSPGRLQGVRVSVPGGPLTLCNTHLGGWRIVGEQTLG
jgi:hypothetical protein